MPSTVPKAELPEILKFHPNWPWDPAVWFFQHIDDKKQLAHAARIQLEYQKSVNQAYGKALQQAEELLKTSMG